MHNNIDKVLSELCMGVASLSWFERKAATLIFGTPPEATYEEALEHALTCCKILESPSESVNLESGETTTKPAQGLSIRAAGNVGKCYEAIGGNPEETKKWYAKALKLEPRDTQDKTLKEEYRQRMKAL